MPELSDFDAVKERVYDVIASRTGRPVGLPEICAETLLSPDVVMRAAAFLIEERRIVPDKESPKLELEAVGA